MVLQKEGYVNAGDFGWDYFIFVIEELNKAHEKNKQNK